MIIDERELTPLILNPPPNITRVRDEDTENKLIEFLERTFEVGFDVETTISKDFFWRRMRTMQFGTGKEQYLIYLRDYCDSADALFAAQGQYGKNLKEHAPKLYHLLQRLVKYLCSDKWLKVGVNLGFEYECLYWQFGIRAYGWYDCMLAEKCIYAGLGGRASLKVYAFYSMEEMVERYFGHTIDKTLQTSFTLDGDLTSAQEEYATLDTRMPLAIKTVQNLIACGETYDSLKSKGKPKLADYLHYVDKLILGDVLHGIINIECETLGSFIDMHVHGERIDRAAWIARTDKAKNKLNITINGLDAIFLQIVGSKLDPVDDEEIAIREIEWKALNDATPQEAVMKAEISKINRAIKKDLMNMDLALQKAELELKIDQWAQARKAQKEILKKQHDNMKKRRTKLNKLKDKCEGDALINYGSDAQLLDVLNDPENYQYFPGLFTKKKDTGELVPKIENLDDEVLEEFTHVPVMKLIREYHGLSKEVGTYGYSWATEWTTHACKEEGWLHPGDGRLHCEFNQYDAATGRSSSSKPNGQNLPQAKEVRHAFIADPPDESIRISNCCDADTIESKTNDVLVRRCTECFQDCTTHAEEYVIVTADMSGAELRIIAEDSGDEFWINAFEKGEDLHSVGTELLFPEEWHKEALPNCAYYALHTAETVAKFPKAKIGEPRRQKCECPEHKVRRNNNKSTNFLLAYGGGPGKLATEIGKPFKVAKELMLLHEQKNPRIWWYLDKSGKDAARDHKAFDLFGRRRILPEPTRERALDNCREYNEESLRIDKNEAEKNIQTFIAVKGKKPNRYEEFLLTHREPTGDEVSRSHWQMTNSITRQGKNMRIQGTNASIIKIAMGSGYAPDGSPFLFHTLPSLGAKIIKMVHDELVIQSPKRNAEKVAKMVGEAFAKAASIKMKRVKMEFDFHIAKYWSK